ncbi:hypothetical protein nvc1_120 [Namao virus]|nr:hypothetical protein nvc1_120 [Namao virus]
MGASVTNCNTCSLAISLVSRSFSIGSSALVKVSVFDGSMAPTDNNILFLIWFMSSTSPLAMASASSTEALLEPMIGTPFDCPVHAVDRDMIYFDYFFIKSITYISCKS